MTEKAPKSSLPLPVWTPILTKKQIVPFQTTRSKSIFGKYSVTPYYYQLPSEKKSATSDLFISSPRLPDNDDEFVQKSTVKDLVDQCKISCSSCS